MGLFEQIQADIKSILENTSDFGVPITLTANDSPATVVNVKGTIKKHHTVYDDMGMPARTKGNTVNATCSVSMLSLNAVSYPYLNAEGRVSFKNHKATWSDATGNSIEYIVKEWYPDYQTAMIALELAFNG
jgi:hypothetical protein